MDSKNQKVIRDLQEWFSNKHQPDCEIAAYGVCTCIAEVTFGCGCYKDNLDVNCSQSWMHK